MPALFFTNAWMLAGLAALSVPIIIHLLLKRRKKRVRFSTVQFFLKVDEQASQRRKLRNWLLLTLRLLICALLVFAFARPYLEDSSAAGQQRRQAIIILDRSLSMQATAFNGPKWTRAKEAVRQILSEMRPDDRAALVGCGMRAEVLSEWAPPATVRQLLNDLQPTFGAATVGQGLAEAGRLLSFRDRKAAFMVYVVSDLQHGACLDLPANPLPHEIEIRLVPIGDLITPNFAVTSLELGSHDGAQPHVAVASFSDEYSGDLQLDLSINGKPVASHFFSLQAGASTNLTLSLPTLNPGWHEVAAHLRAHDALPADNARFQSIFVPEPTRVLIAEPRLGGRIFEEASFFAATALNPGHGTLDAAQSRFALEKVSPDELAQRLAAKKEALPCSMVVLPGLKQIPSALGNALLSYLQAGGGLLVFLGESVSANRYNVELRSVLPAELGAMEISTDADLGWRIGEYDTRASGFAAFQTPNSGDLSLARFTKRFSLLPRPEHAVIARFEDTSPFAIAGTIGAGRVVLVNTSADTVWNDWPKHKTFVPWIHETSHYLAGAQNEDQAWRNLRVLAGAENDIDLGPGAARGNFKLRSPHGPERPLPADAQGQLQGATFAVPGVYSLRNGDGMEVRRLAVNVPPQESDLTALPPGAVHEQIVRAPEAQQMTLAAGLFGSGGNQKELWRVLLIAAFVLLSIEMFLANRTVG